MPDLGSVHGAEATRRSRRRRASGDSGGEEDAKAAGGKQEYKCRFCAMKFEKSQALGGHMNRHRQEREKEQFRQAQQIVSSVAQQQMPRTWSSLSAEMIQSPSGPGGIGTTTAQRLSSHLSRGTTHQQYVAPPVSFATLYRPTSPANCNPGTPLPPSPGSNCNFYLPTNASSCNLPGNNTNVQNQQQQLQQWLGSMDGSAPRSSSGSFHHHPAENMAISFQAAAGVSSEVLANMLRNSGTPDDGSPLVSPTTPSSQAPGPYDVIYNSHLGNAFYSGGM